MFPDAVNLQKLSTSVPTVSVSRPVARRLKPLHLDQDPKLKIQLTSLSGLLLVLMA